MSHYHDVITSDLVGILSAENVECLDDFSESCHNYVDKMVELKREQLLMRVICSKDNSFSQRAL